MNTKQQIEEAIQDYRKGKNGFENAPKWQSSVYAQNSNGVEQLK